MRLLYNWHDSLSRQEICPRQRTIIGCNNKPTEKKQKADDKNNISIFQRSHTLRNWFLNTNLPPPFLKTKHVVHF